MEVLSKDKIKPSSSTPQHLQKLNLSLLDQIAPPTYIHLIFFYESPNFDPSQVSQNLKKSLCDVLTNFHHLAGRMIQENSSIDCNDDGVEYVETRVHSYMSEITKNPNPEELQKYVPMEPHGLGLIPLSVQVNMFDCGGIAVGICISHKMADTQSLVFFMNAWAATCRKGLQTSKPTFDLLSRFPPVDHLSKICPRPPPSNNQTPENIVTTKRFVFDREMLLELKKVGASEEVQNPTKIEAVTAFILRNFMISFSSKKERNLVVLHAVNVRSKMSPPLPVHSFGNGCLQATANWSKSEVNHVAYPEIVTKLRNAIRKIDGDYLKRMENEGGIFDDVSLKEGNGLSEVCIFSSWCRFPVYKVDYGWGEPNWVSTMGVPFKNLIVFMDTKCGHGVEAWVTMAERDMAMIETNYAHLIAHITI